MVAALAYVDPGNVAANLSAGAQYGYLLVWALVLACLMAMLVLSIIPVIVFYAFSQKHIIKGVIAGAVKG